MMKVMGDPKTSGCDAVNSGLTTYPHVAHTSLITSLSFPSMNPQVELIVILLPKFSDVLPPIIFAIDSSDYLLK
jgi:hypothetical protein